jgi:predicted unusual protein kinase regulating ubiquinone biosynthesis (AarF/ABC1/UbiB family)
VPSKTSSVPSSRISRLAKFGVLTTGIAASMLVNGAKRLAAGERPKISDLLLTPANATRVVKQLANMRGAAMKLGQLLSMDAGDLIPPELAQILSALQSSATAMPNEQVEQVLFTAWGPNWKKRVKSFDFSPVAAASIGQVHKAVLKGGQTLAIKLQYPGVRKSIDSDVDNVASLLRFSGLVPSDIDLTPFLRDAKKQLHNEANYLREGEYLQRFHDLLIDDESLLVPRWHKELSSADLLAMDFVESVPIDDLVNASPQVRNLVVKTLFTLFLREVFEFRMIQTDPNFANYRYAPNEKQLVLLDFGAVQDYSIAFTTQFKRLVKAALLGDKNRMTAAAQALGYFDETTQPRHKAMVMEIFDLAMQIQGFEGEYDFEKSTLAAELNVVAFALINDKEFWHVPSTQVLLLQRKAAGLYLLGVKLKAKVNVNALVKDALHINT